MERARGNWRRLRTGVSGKKSPMDNIPRDKKLSEREYDFVRLLKMIAWMYVKQSFPFSAQSI